MKRAGGRLGVIAVVAALLVACGNDDAKTGATGAPSGPPGSIPVPSAKSSVEAKVPKAEAPPATVDAKGAVPSFAPLVKRTSPAVVLVKGWVKKTNNFGREFLDSHGVGSGFVYDADGFVLTNNHVIDGATEIEVKLADGRKLDAKVVGADKPTDVAVLELQEGKPPYPHLKMGDSDALEVGDWVIAIGNPFGLEHTVSAGILSAKGRTKDDVKGLDPTGYFNFLQTDASINPGNSGGPLLNLAGQVVGINSAVRANANNIGFAIPMDMVLQLLPVLLRDGKIQRSAIGITADDLSQDDIDKGIKAGARVMQVRPGQSGDKAGLARGDIIIEFNGKPVRSQHELRWLASIAGVGKTVSMRVRRGDRTFDMRITLRELEEP